jgi:pimeloyl-ACP methyl ester carboxylesterase
MVKRRRPRWLVLVVALVAVVGFEQLYEVWAAHAMVEGPNGGVPTAPPRRGELRLTVGPPDAALSVELVAPKLSPRATIFVLPGLRDDKDYMRSFAEQLAEAGYRAVLIDSRGHGRSSGRWLTYGVQEARDLSQLADALAIDGPIGVLGHSYGGSVALEWAGREPRVRAVVSLSPFSTMRELMRDLPVLGALTPRFVLERSLARASRLAGFDPNDADARRAAHKTKAPILIIHGDADLFVPIQQSRSIAAGAPPGHIQLVEIPGSDHEHLPGDPRVWPVALDFLSRAFP